MNFEALPVVGAFRIELDVRSDERGDFTRAFCADEMVRHGLEPVIAQISTSYNRMAGTLRGLHYQLPPSTEVKVVRAIRGSVWDVVVDIRADSPTYLQWHAEELSASNRAMMYVPRGVAHGFISLADDTELLYMISNAHDPPAERGLRWDDPAIALPWPIKPTVVSERDRMWPDLNQAFHGMNRLRLTR